MAEPAFIGPCLTAVDRDAIRRHLARDQFFWLDLIAPSTEDRERLGEILKFHPLALEDTIKFGQRPKLDDYQDYMLLVFYGAREEPGDEQGLLYEVHLFVSGGYLVTVRRDPIPASDSNAANSQGRPLKRDH